MVASMFALSAFLAFQSNLHGRTPSPLSSGRSRTVKLSAATSSSVSSSITCGTDGFWNVCSNLREPTYQEQLLEIFQNSNDDWNINQRDPQEGCTVLHYACRQNALQVVRHCLEDLNAEPNLCTYEYESTPLKWAAHKGYLPIVELLWEHGAGPEWRDYFGYTPLQYACLGGHSTVVGTLLGIEDTTPFENDDDLVLEDIAKLLKIFSEDEDDVNAVDDTTGFTPLHLACSLGRTDLVDALLELGAWVDQPNEEGRTPLFFAAGCGHAQIMDQLLDWGANIHAFTKIEKTSCHIATPGWTPLHEACEKNQLACVQYLLDRMDVNAVETKGKETPLIIAAQHGHVEVADLLIQSGADVDRGDDWNTTPLHTACRQNHESLVSLLLEKGANVHVENHSNETPLHQACWLGRESIAQFLLEYGANPQAKNKDQQTPLDYARQRGHSKLLQALKKHNG